MIKRPLTNEEKRRLDAMIRRLNSGRCTFRQLAVRFGFTDDAAAYNWLNDRALDVDGKYIRVDRVYDIVRSQLRLLDFLTRKGVNRLAPVKEINKPRGGETVDDETITEDQVTDDAATEEVAITSDDLEATE